MIRIENVDIHGITRAVYSARNAKNSWDKSDSDLNTNILGDADLTLAQKLSKAGTDHRKFMRMIVVYADITAPLYWLKEFDTYKVGTVANSCSTMHKIHSKPIEVSDFSIDDFEFTNADDTMEFATDTFGRVISALEFLRQEFIETKDKKYWRFLIQLLPESYNQKRTVMLNYEVLSNMYHSRKAHKLYEWREFCKWVETLPYSELITENKGE